MSELATRTCTPCKGGTPPIAEDDARAMLGQAPGWELLEQGKRIERTFRFRNFKAALDFVNQVGAVAEEEQHHPDLTFGWGYATVSLFTHKIKGLHENDFIMAAKINRLAPA
jgi:4a-hydroxytetrahydrobiopterin dehydratase